MHRLPLYTLLAASLTIAAQAQSFIRTDDAAAAAAALASGQSVDVRISAQRGIEVLPQQPQYYRQNGRDVVPPVYYVDDRGRTFRVHESDGRTVYVQVDDDKRKKRRDRDDDDRYDDDDDDDKRKKRRYRDDDDRYDDDDDDDDRKRKKRKKRDRDDDDDD